MLISFYRNYES